MESLNLKIIYLSLVLFLLPSYLIRFSLLGIPTTLLEIFIYLGVVWALFYPRDWQKLKAIPLKIWLPILLFVFSAIMGVLVAPAQTQALGQLKGFIIDPVLFIGLIYLWVPQNKLEKLYSALIFSGGVASLWAIYQKLAGLTTFDGRVLGPWQHDPSASPNFLSLYLTPLALMALTQTKKQKLFWLVFILILTGIALSGSRGGLLAVAAATGYFWLTQILKPTRLRTIGMAGLIIIILTASYLAGRPDFSATPDSGRISSSNNIRWEIWRVTVKEIIAQHWLLGIGLGNFQNHFTELTKNRVNFPEFISPHALTPHNLFLTLLTNGGIIMLGSILVLLYLLYFDSKNSDHISKTVMLAILCYGLIDTPFFKNDLSILFWLIIVSYVVQICQKQNSPQK